MNFEEYIKSQKENLHTETPAFKVWTGIQQQIKPKKNHRSTWLVAASFLTLFSLGSIFVLQNKNKQQSTLPAPTVSNNTPNKLEQIEKLDTPTTLAKQIEKSNIKKSISASALESKTEKKAILYNDIKQIAKKDKQFTLQYQGQGFYDSAIVALKQKIEATPVKWVNNDYYKVYLTEYKNLEEQESIWRKQPKNGLSETDLILGLIQINQRKLTVLDNLLKQINTINNKKGDTTQTNNYNKIII